MTGNMYIDPGADTEEGYAISSASRALVRKMVGDDTPEDRIRQRCAIAVGDFVMAELMEFIQNPVDAGLVAIASGATIITDIRMVQMGIRKKEHNSDVICALDHGAEISAEKGITRSSAGFIALREKIDGAIVVIGNAPSALLTLCRMIKDEDARPALVIGTPVGFVNAKESKELLRELETPSISNRGTRGGTPPAIACMNEIIVMYIEKNRSQ